MEWYNHIQMALGTNGGKWASLIGVSHCSSRPHGIDLIPCVAQYPPWRYGWEFEFVNQCICVWFLPSLLATGYLNTRWVGCVLHRDLIWALALPQPAKNWNGWVEGWGSLGGDQEPLCPATGFHMWGAEWDVSQINHHLGKRTICQEKGETQNKWLEKLTKWRIESRRGVGIHGGKDGLIGGLTERKATDLEGCCFHLLSWLNNQHLSFFSKGWASVPCVNPVTLCE